MCFKHYQDMNHWWWVSENLETSIAMIKHNIDNLQIIANYWMRWLYLFWHKNMLLGWLIQCFYLYFCWSCSLCYSGMSKTRGAMMGNGYFSLIAACGLFFSNVCTCLRTWLEKYHWGHFELCMKEDSLCLFLQGVLRSSWFHYT